MVQVNEKVMAKFVTMTFAEKAMALIVEAQNLGIHFEVQKTGGVMFFYDGNKELFAEDNKFHPSPTDWCLDTVWEPWFFSSRRDELAAAAILESARKKMREAMKTVLNEQEQAAFIKWLRSDNGGLAL